MLYCRAYKTDQKVMQESLECILKFHSLIFQTDYHTKGFRLLADSFLHAV